MNPEFVVVTVKIPQSVRARIEALQEAGKLGTISELARPAIEEAVTKKETA